MAEALGENFDGANQEPADVVKPEFPDISGGHLAGNEVAIPLDLSLLTEAQFAALMPGDPFENVDLDEVAVSVEWPTHETDIIEVEIFGVKSSELEKIREDTSDCLIASVKTMLEKLEAPTNIYDPYASNPRVDDDDYRYGRIAWAGEAPEVNIRLTTFNPEVSSSIEDDLANAKCHVNGSSDWVEGVGRILSTKGPVEIEMKFKTGVPITNRNGAVTSTYILQVEQRFLISDLTSSSPQIDWLETIPTPDQREEYDDVTPLDVLGKYLGQMEKPPAIRMAEIDLYLLRVGLSRLISQ